MKRLVLGLFLLLSILQTGLCQLSTDQKMVDFQQLVALFAKRYAFYEWKRDALHYDGLNLASWAGRIKASTTDVDFFDLCAQYVASYQDGHSTFLLPSDFEAKLGFTVDLYSGKVLIDSIDRKLLAESDFPFQVGDELLSIDGKPAAGVIQALALSLGDGNPRTMSRDAAGLLTDRYQGIFPRAPEVGDNATLLVQRRGGATETYVVPWIKTGEPYTLVGPVPTPTFSSARQGNRFAGTSATAAWPPYMENIRKFQDFRLSRKRFSLGDGEVAPVFTLPENFTQRLGTSLYDSFFTGTFAAKGLKIGYLRIPTFDFFSTRTLQTEITYFQNNTGGLVVDVMRNPGGYGCAAEEIAQYLMPDWFHSLGMSIRATWEDVLNAQYNLEDAQYWGATDDEIAELKNELQAFRDAYAQNRGLTVPLPICGTSMDLPAVTDKNGAVLGYTKPIMLLTDELSASAAELFSAILQDNKRALVYGMRTDGAGGAIEQDAVGFYSESGSSLARAILIRKDPVTTPEYPAAPYIENIGVRPDVVADYMTEDNLVNGGRPFVDGFLNAMADYINSAPLTTSPVGAVSATARQRGQPSNDSRHPRPPAQSRAGGRSR